MRHILFAAVTAAFVLAAGADAAGVIAPTDAAMQRLMDKTGLDAQLGHVAPALGHSIYDTIDATGVLDEAAMARLRGASEIAYAPDLLRAEVKAQLKAHLSSADVQAVLTWAESPVGKRLRALEVQGEREEAEADSPEFAMERQAAYDTLPAARRDALQRLAKLTLAAESAADTLTSIMIGNLTTLAQTAPPGTFNLREVKDKLARQHERISDELTPGVLAAFGAMYGNATDADLAAYIAFAGSPAGKRFSAAERAATNKAMTDAALRFSHELTTDRAHRAGLATSFVLAAHSKRARSFR